MNDDNCIKSYSLNTKKYVFIIPLLYLLCVQALRLIVTPSVDFDHAEQLYFSQTFELGYNGQPPLFTYISRVLFYIFGVDLLWLLLLKVSLFMGLIYAMYRLARSMCFSQTQTYIAVFGLAMLPQVIYHSQRMLSHTVLVTMLSALTLWQVSELLNSSAKKNIPEQTHFKNSHIRHYVYLGIIAGLGLLSKYNYLLFLQAIIISMLLIKDYRRLILSPKFVLAVVICSVIFLPHFLWSLEHFALATEGLNKVQAEKNSTVRGFINAILVFLGFIAVLALCAIPIIRQRFTRSNTKDVFENIRHHEAQERFFWVLTGVLLFEVLVFVFLSSASIIKERWLQPLFFYVPVLVAFCIPKEAGNVGKKPVRFYLGACGFFAILVLFLLPVQTINHGKTGKYKWENRPYREVLTQIRNTYGKRNYVVTDDMTLAGNLRVVFPQVRIILPHYDGAIASTDNQVKTDIKPEVSGKGLLVCTDKLCINEDDIQAWTRQYDLAVTDSMTRKFSSPYYFATEFATEQTTKNNTKQSDIVVKTDRFQLYAVSLANQ